MRYSQEALTGGIEMLREQLADVSVEELDAQRDKFIQGAVARG